MAGGKKSERVILDVPVTQPGKADIEITVNPHAQANSCTHEAKPRIEQLQIGGGGEHTKINFETGKLHRTEEKSRPEHRHCTGKFQHRTHTRKTQIHTHD
jgi:hypothetical protein